MKSILAICLLILVVGVFCEERPFIYEWLSECEEKYSNDRDQLILCKVSINVVNERPLVSTNR